MSEPVQQFPDEHMSLITASLPRKSNGGLLLDHGLDSPGGGMGRRMVATSKHSGDFRIAVIGHSSGQARNESSAQRYPGTSVPACEIRLGQAQMSADRVYDSLERYGLGCFPGIFKDLRDCFGGNHAAS